MDKLICVGKNYLEHARELGDAVPEMPVLFLKPPSVAIQATQSGQTLEVALPSGRGPVHHECEIVVRIDASGAIQAVTLGLDMTLRDVQAQLKKNGHPWEISKIFRGSAILGHWIPVQEFGEYLNTEFEFAVDGQVRQRGAGKQMRLSPTDCIRYASEYFPLVDGDLVFTGTPAGVGPVLPGQTGELSWGGRLLLKVRWV